MHNVQDYSVPYNNAVCPAICKDLHFTHTWKARAWPHHFTASHLLDMNSTNKRTCLGNVEVFWMYIVYLLIWRARSCLIIIEQLVFFWCSFKSPSKRSLISYRYSINYAEHVSWEIHKYIPSSSSSRGTFLQI
jgi:hypothetical protein